MCKINCSGGCKECAPEEHTKKQQVNYDSTQFKHIVLGQSALVFPKNHPDSSNVSNTKHVITSRVVRMFPDGSFETINSFYQPV